MLGFHLLLQWLLRENNLGGARGLVSQARDQDETPFFSEAVGSAKLCWVNVKGCHVRPIMDAYVSCVLGFSYIMYIDSNHRDSRI
jgi:hypothetical protein